MRGFCEAGRGAQRSSTTPQGASLWTSHSPLMKIGKALRCIACDHRDLRRAGAVRRAISASARSASLTEAALGKTSVTSGSRTTTFELSWSRLAYFPRTKPAGKSDALYSGRSSSSATCFLIFFIELSFTARHLASTDDPKRIHALCVCNCKQSPQRRQAKDYKPILILRMVRVNSGN